MSEKIIALKLSSGEEIIARVKDVSHDTFTLDRPMIVGVVQAQDGSLIIQIVPWLASNQDGSCKVNRNLVVAEIEPNAELEKGYLTKTSGIQLV